MEENISYRKLRLLKNHGISHTSEQLLKLPSRYINHDKNSQNIMTQNVTLYLHMLPNYQIKSSDIKWIINLRKYCREQSKENKYNFGNHVPDVFYKNTEIRKIRSNSNNNKGVNVGEYSQFFGKESRSICQDQVEFLGKLRSTQSKGKNQIQNIHPQLFNRYASKEKTSLPRLLKKSAIKKIKTITCTDYQQNLDGTHQFPPYTSKILRQKNTSLLTSLTKKFTPINLPSLAWSVGLRSY